MSAGNRTQVLGAMKPVLFSAELQPHLNVDGKLTFIIGRRSSTLCTFSRASLTSNKPFGLFALEERGKGRGRRQGRLVQNQISRSLYIVNDAPSDTQLNAVGLCIPRRLTDRVIHPNQ